jgi:hypothetical protein
MATAAYIGLTNALARGLAKTPAPTTSARAGRLALRPLAQMSGAEILAGLSAGQQNELRAKLAAEVAAKQRADAARQAAHDRAERAAGVAALQSVLATNARMGFGHRLAEGAAGVAASAINATTPKPAQDHGWAEIHADIQAIRGTGTRAAAGSQATQRPAATPAVQHGAANHGWADIHAETRQRTGRA